MSEEDNKAELDEVNRLVSIGLDVMTAIAVANGESDEAFEVDRAAEARAVHRWCRGRKNIPSSLTPLWDLDPARFYLAYDGDSPHDHQPDGFVLVEADVAEVHARLTYASDRDVGPWHRRYKSKTCGIAYRWVHKRAVTPPVLVECERQVHIGGGMHRYHLARHYGTARMPFLIQANEAEAVLALLPSARRIRSQAAELVQPSATDFCGRP